MTAETNPFPAEKDVDLDIDSLCNEISSLTLLPQNNNFNRVPNLSMLLTGLEFAEDVVWDNLCADLCKQTNEEIIHGFIMNFLRALSNAVSPNTLAYFKVTVVDKYMYGYVRFVLDGKFNHRVVINTHLDTFTDGTELREWCMFMEYMVSRMKGGYSNVVRAMNELGPMYEGIISRGKMRAQQRFQ